MKPILALAAICAAAIAAGPSAAENEFAPQLKAYLTDNLSTWIETPEIVNAIKAQNAKTASYTQSQIDDLDREWRAEIGKSERPTIRPVIENPAADFLRQKVMASGGVITEAFVMDDRGLNVAASAPTSDYWQGDEAKFSQTFGKGAGAVDLGDVEFDESTQTYQAQLSTTIVDPDSGKPIGAITIGLNVEALE